MNKQSNTYTILYSAIMVIVVGAVLALVYGALKPKQEENIKIDKMKQMLSAVRIVTESDDQVIDTYNKYIPEACIINVAGETVSNDKDAAFGRRSVGRNLGICVNRRKRQHSLRSLFLARKRDTRFGCRNRKARFPRAIPGQEPV